MNTERVKLEVYEHLPKLLETVKATAICAEINTTSQWLNGKLKRAPSSKYSTRKFTQIDIEKLNEGIWSLARKLSVANVEYTDNRQEVIDQIKNNLSGVFLKSIAVKKMGWTESKLKIYMVKSSAKGNYLTFSKNDVQQLVLAVREVAMRMLSIEYCLEE